MLALKIEIYFSDCVRFILKLIFIVMEKIWCRRYKSKII